MQIRLVLAVAIAAAGLAGCEGKNMHYARISEGYGNYPIQRAEENKEISAKHERKMVAVSKEDDDEKEGKEKKEGQAKKSGEKKHKKSDTTASSKPAKGEKDDDDDEKEDD